MGVKPKSPPAIEQLLRDELEGEARPIATILAGHSGSDKFKLWDQRLADSLQIPFNQRRSTHHVDLS